MLRSNFAYNWGKEINMRYIIGLIILAITLPAIAEESADVAALKARIEALEAENAKLKAENAKLKEAAEKAAQTAEKKKAKTSNEAKSETPAEKIEPGTIEAFEADLEKAGFSLKKHRTYTPDEAAKIKAAVEAWKDKPISGITAVRKPNEMGQIDGKSYHGHRLVLPGTQNVGVSLRVIDDAFPVETRRILNGRQQVRWQGCILTATAYYNEVYQSLDISVQIDPATIEPSEAQAVAQ